MEDLYSIQIRKIISTIREEGWPFIFICTYLFFEYVRPQTIYPFIDIIPWVPAILLLTILSAFLGNEFSKGTPHILNKLMFIYGSIVLLSCFFSEHQDISFSNLRVFFDWFIIYFLIVFLITNEKRFFIFFLSFLVYSFKMSQHGFITWAKRGFAFSSWGVTGAPGWFHNSGEVGIQMCIFVPLAFAFVVATYKYLSKFWLVFFLLMPLTGAGTAIASSSRGAIVGLGGASLWGILKKPKTMIAGILIILLSAFVVVKVMPPEFKQRFETAGEDRNSTHRLERWKHGLEAMNRYPVFGVGFEAWSEYYPDNFALEDDGTLLVHNIFVQAGSELGYSGLLVFCCMILACFFTTRRVRKLCVVNKDRFHSILSYGFDAALVGFLVSGSFVTVLYYPYFWIHCAMTTCLYTAVIKKQDKNVRNEVD